MYTAFVGIFDSPRNFSQTRLSKDIKMNQNKLKIWEGRGRMTVTQTSIPEVVLLSFNIFNGRETDPTISILWASGMANQSLEFIIIEDN